MLLDDFRYSEMGILDYFFNWVDIVIGIVEVWV